MRTIVSAYIKKFETGQFQPYEKTNDLINACCLLGDIWNPTRHMLSPQGIFVAKFQATIGILDYWMEQKCLHETAEPNLDLHDAMVHITTVFDAVIRRSFKFQVTHTLLELPGLPEFSNIILALDEIFGEIAPLIPSYCEVVAPFAQELRRYFETKAWWCLSRI